MGRGVADLPPRAGQGGLLVVDVYLDARQESTVEQPTHIWPSQPVGLGSALHEGLRLVVGLHDRFARVLGLGSLSLGFRAFLGDAFLLTLKEVQGYRVGVGHLDKLEALGVEAGDAPLCAQQPVGLVTVAKYECVQLTADGFSVEGVEADPMGPGALDVLLDLEGWQVRQVAAGTRVSLDADEVVELVTVPAPSGGVLQPRPTASA